MSILQRRFMRVAAAAVGVLLGGCLPPITLKPTVDHLPSVAQVPVSVGVYYSPEFRNYEYAWQPYEIIKPELYSIGPASVTLFQQLLPKLFKEVVQVDSRPPLAAEGRELAGVIEPSIEKVHLRHVRMNLGAKVTYRFTVYAPDGERLASWTVTGEGHKMSPSYRGNNDPAVELAIEDAATKFMTSLDEVPEAKRWARGLAMEGATAPATAQATAPAAGRDRAAVRGVYDGVVSVTADPNAEPAPDRGGGETEAPKLDLNAARVFAVNVSVANEGSHRLLVRRSDIALVAPNGREVNAIPAPLVAVLATARRPGLPNVAGGVGVAALPGLFFALANAASMSAAGKEMEAHVKTLRGQELPDATLARGQSAAGLVYFPRAAARSRDVVLKVPVVDLDAATRYVVRLPLTGFRPYVLDPSAPETKGQAK